jgi:hypothetical protein
MKNKESWELAKYGMNEFIIGMVTKWSKESIKQINSKFKRNYTVIKYSKHVDCLWSLYNDYNKAKKNGHKNCTLTEKIIKESLWLTILKYYEANKDKWISISNFKKHPYINLNSNFPNHLYMTFLKLVTYKCLDVKKDKCLVFKFKGYPNEKYIV